MNAQSPLLPDIITELGNAGVWTLADPGILGRRFSSVAYPTLQGVSQDSLCPPLSLVKEEQNHLSHRCSEDVR
jgi:hypothetical protein